MVDLLKLPPPYSSATNIEATGLSERSVPVYQLHGVTSQNTAMFKATSIRISKFAQSNNLYYVSVLVIFYETYKKQEFWNVMFC